MDMFLVLVIMFFGLMTLLVVVMLIQARQTQRQPPTPAKEVAPAHAVATSTAVDMTPPALQNISPETSVVIASRKFRAISALSAVAKMSATALVSAASKVTARFRTVSGYQAQWYSVPGVQLRQPGEPCAVRRTDKKSIRTASRLRRECIAAHRQAEGQRELDALARHLAASGAI